MSKLTTIEGIGPATSEKLVDAGIKTIEALLKAGATSAGRKQIAEKTGLLVVALHRPDGSVENANAKSELSGDAGLVMLGTTEQFGVFRETFPSR